MVCELSGICGGCPLRCLDTARYQEQKLAAFRETLKHIRQDNIAEGKPVFVPVSYTHLTLPTNLRV